MTTNTTSIDLNAKFEAQEASKARHIMAFTFGLIIPAIFSMLGLPFVGIWLAGFVFCVYAFARQNSDAAIFGMFISAIAVILLLGRVEMADQLNEEKPHEILPAYVMQ